MSRIYTYKQLVNAIKKIGIRKGDVVFVHSALFPLGKMKDVEVLDIPRNIFGAFREMIGAKGTIAVPAAYEDYARFGKPYDCRKSPVDMAQGVFSQYVVNLKESFRTYSPMMGVAAHGPLAKEISHAPTASACGTDSAWEKLFHYNAKYCFLGIKPSLAFTFVRFIQFRFGVPHFYNKIYTTPIFEDGQPIYYPVVCPVRYRDPKFKITENCQPWEELLYSHKMIKSEAVGGSNLYCVGTTQKLFDLGTQKLRENLYYFQKAAPEFTPGEIPMDGPTGQYIPDHIRLKEGK